MGSTGPGALSGYLSSVCLVRGAVRDYARPWWVSRLGCLLPSHYMITAVKSDNTIYQSWRCGIVCGGLKEGTRSTRPSCGSGRAGRRAAGDLWVSCVGVLLSCAGSTKATVRSPNWDTDLKKRHKYYYLHLCWRWYICKILFHIRFSYLLFLVP